MRCFALENVYRKAQIVTMRYDRLQIMRCYGTENDQDGLLRLKGNNDSTNMTTGPMLDRPRVEREKYRDR